MRADGLVKRDSGALTPRSFFRPAGVRAEGGQGRVPGDARGPLLGPLESHGLGPDVRVLDRGGCRCDRGRGGVGFSDGDEAWGSGGGVADRGDGGCWSWAGQFCVGVCGDGAVIRVHQVAGDRRYGSGSPGCTG